MKQINYLPVLFQQPLGKGEGKRTIADTLHGICFSDCVGDAKMLRRSYLFERPCKRAGGPRRLVHTKQNKSASQRNFFAQTASIELVEVPLRGTWLLESQDQAACIFDALAWSFEQNRVFDPLCIFDA